jgi:hypothetical protein
LGLDDFAARDIIEEHLGRKLECECQVLFDARELRKEALGRQFGVDFDSGEVGLVDWPELQNRFRLDFRFGFGILTSDDGLAGFLGWERKMGYGQEVQASVHWQFD